MWGDIFKFINNNKDTISTIGQVASPIVSGIGAYNKYKIAQNQNKLAEDTYNYNKMLNDRYISKQDQQQNNVDNAFASVFGNEPKKKNQTYSY